MADPGVWKSKVPPRPSGTGKVSIESQVAVALFEEVIFPLGIAVEPGTPAGLVNAGLVRPNALRMSVSPKPSAGNPPKMFTRVNASG